MSYSSISNNSSYFLNELVEFIDILVFYFSGVLISIFEIIISSFWSERIFLCLLDKLFKNLLYLFTLFLFWFNSQLLFLYIFNIVEFFSNDCNRLLLLLLFSMDFFR